MTAQQMEELNLLQPKSAAALSAEEWTIQPSSTMPSFLEMMMIQDASRSSREALKSAIDIVARWINTLDDAPLIPGMINAASSFAGPLTASFRRNIRRLTRQAKVLVYQYKEEIELVIWYILERFSLQSSASATFLEAMYGTRRSKLVAFAEGEAVGQRRSGRRRLVGLSAADKTRVAIVSCLMPYLMQKSYRIYRQYQLRLFDDNSLLSRVYVASYLPVSVVLAFLKLLCRWRFLSGTSLFFDPSSLLMNQIVRRIAQDEMSAPKAPSTLTKSPDGQLSTQRSLLYFLSASVALSWLVQIRAAWERRRREQSQEENMNTTRCSIPPPPPHRRPDRNGKQIGITSDGCCPLCLGPRTNPTATSSGYVFCETCIRSHVRQFGCCPITGASCNESALVKLYEPSNTGEH